VTINEGSRPKRLAEIAGLLDPCLPDRPDMMGGPQDIQPGKMVTIP
jgi:hypothetical protein